VRRLNGLYLVIPIWLSMPLLCLGGAFVVWGPVIGIPWMTYVFALAVAVAVGALTWRYWEDAAQREPDGSVSHRVKRRAAKRAVARGETELSAKHRATLEQVGLAGIAHTAIVNSRELSELYDRGYIESRRFETPDNGASAEPQLYWRLTARGRAALGLSRHA